MNQFMINYLEKIVNIPSPSGFTSRLMEVLGDDARDMGYEVSYTSRGALMIRVPGRTGARLCLAAHGDTLGAVVRSINPDGTLRIVPVGGYTMESVEGEYCTVHTRDGRTYPGTALTKAPSVHVFDDARSLKREEENMLIRLDEMVFSREDVKALGIQNGDYISWDPRFQALENGLIRSRHLDDKASVAVLFALLKEMKEREMIPAQELLILITNFEEVGFGASYLPEGIPELLVVDMGAVGDDLDGREDRVSIVVKDSQGPFDYNMTTRLIGIAGERNLDYAVDVFRHYGSDAAAAIRGGANVRCALIGQGVQASHHMERTHVRGMENTLELIKGYIGL